MKIVPVILSGGAGTRLWPESRKSFPKPFMAMPDGETLIEKTLSRARLLADGGPIITVTNQDYHQLTRDAYENAEAHSNRHIFLLEPEARNTAPAITMAAAWASEALGEDVCLVILPSDHLIAEVDKFRAATNKAAELAAAGHLVTYGIKPTRPETGYGYIKSAAPLLSGYAVDSFVEKPDLETAEGYVASGNYLWNSGMFCFTPGSFLKAADEIATELLAGARACLAATDCSDDTITFDRGSFGELQAISVDYAIFERASNVGVVAGDFDWNDVGSWQAISDLAASNAGGAEQDTVLVDSENVYVRKSDRLVALVGVSNLVVVDTADALLICDRSKTQQVKDVVEKLKEGR